MAGSLEHLGRSIMLRWRLVLGILIVVILVGVAGLDHLSEGRWAGIPVGAWLLPVAVLFAVAATREVLYLLAAAGIRPVAWAVYGGNLLLVVSGWLPPPDWAGAEAAPLAARTVWPLLALAVGTMLVLAGEMARYRQPGGVTVRAAGAVFTLVYVGLMLSLAVQLRMGRGVAALSSLLIVVKTADTGAYLVGRLIGRHQMAPVLSPRKTVEGAVGGVVCGCLASWATFRWLVPLMSPAVAPAACWRWLLFGLLLSGAGMLGDLAESLLKRDAGLKDSSRWLPGLGGVLDLLDSILLAAPVAWFCWVVGLVGS